MLIHRVVFMAVLLGQATQPQAAPQAASPDPSQMTLADRAAAMRKARSSSADSQSSRPTLSPEQRGFVRGDRYVNDFLHFQILLAGQWEPLSAERMETSLAAAREIEQESGLRGGSGRNRVLWMSDSSGGNVILSLARIPPDAPTAPQQLVEALRKISFARTQGARDLQEPVLLGDGAHKFAAMRYSFTLHETELVQSSQVVVVDGFLLNFTITGHSEKDVTANLRALRSRLTWTDAQAADGPPATSRPARKDPFQPHR